MDSTLTWTSLGALFGAMVVLAAVPSVSVFAVVARSAALGFLHGLYTTLGIVAGDIVFILVAIFGLSMVAEVASGWIAVIRYAGAVYLVVLGVMLWRAEPGTPKEGVIQGSSPWASFLAGLFITLGDQKAILFYLGFFPAFVDLAALRLVDGLLVVVTAIVSLLGVKLVYAFLAARVGVRLGAGAGRWLNRLAATMLVGVGVMLVVGALG